MTQNRPPARHILIVDDDESVRYMLQKRLFQSGYVASLAAGGSHAIQMLKTDKKYDLIICELKMPGKDGVEVLRFMRENGIQSHAIAMTAAPERDKIIAAGKLGVKDVLLKPVRYAELLQIVYSKLSLEDDGIKQAA